MYVYTYILHIFKKMKSKLDFNSDKEYSEYLRYYFSGVAMQGLIASGATGEGKKEVARASVEQANELLIQLSEK